MLKRALHSFLNLMVPLGTSHKQFRKKKEVVHAVPILLKLCKYFRLHFSLSLAENFFFASLCWIVANFFVGCARDKGEEAEEAFMQIEKE